MTDAEFKVVADGVLRGLLCAIVALVVGLLFNSEYRSEEWIAVSSGAFAGYFAWAWLPDIAISIFVLVLVLVLFGGAVALCIAFPPVAVALFGLLALIVYICKK